ncbi:MAG: hypothetical protein H0T10_05920 [Actinobacteria bacterium]|nr:hypothetical protein [Actinomycetota bacterium]
MSQVRSEYRHITKRIEPAPRLALGDAILKWYDIAPEDEPVPPEIRELARSGLQQATESGALDFSGDLGFTILHRCGKNFYFLIVSTWRNDNELRETVWAKNGDEEDSFSPWPVDGTHRPAFCVWELGAVWHEQQAWSKYLRSQRSEAAKQAYLRDAHTGVV